MVDDLSKIVSFEGSFAEMMADHKPGNVYQNMFYEGRPAGSTLALAEVDALAKRYSAPVVDAALDPSHWVLDWADASSARPSLRVATNLDAAR